jgi:hypothetical protein
VLYVLVLGLHPVTAEDGAELLERTKANVASFVQRLPDFSCVRVKTRELDAKGTGRKFKRLDTREERVRVSGGRETAELLTLNGKAVSEESKRTRAHYSGGGEFGRLLWWVFDPDVQTGFEYGLGRRALHLPLSCPSRPFQAANAGE